MSKTVLAIEDDPQIAELIKMLLAAEEVAVFHYSDGAEGYAGILQHKPDLVLLDIMVPGMSGWEIHYRVRQDEQTREIPIIILSVSQPSFEQRIAFKNSKVDFYITKPFEILELRQKINEVLQVKHWRLEGTLPDTVPAARTQIKPIRDLLLAAMKVEETKRKSQEAATTTEDGLPATKPRPATPIAPPAPDAPPPTWGEGKPES
jgi:DNA-binding response OmpR family regulator